MKTTIKILGIFVLVAVVVSGIAACKKGASERGEPAPEYLADCNVFVKIIPGEETILLAKSEPNTINYVDKQHALLVGFEAEYGKGNVEWINLVQTRPELGVNPDLYEVTITVDAKYSKRSKIQYTDGGIRIEKFYHWGFSESEIDEFISHLKSTYVYYDNGFIYSDAGIVSVVKKNLGSEEIHNMPITF